MRIDVVTLFPELFESFVRTSFVGRAVTQGTAQFRFKSPREHGLGRHRSVDDTPYGGGSGMVMRVDVLVSTLEALDAGLFVETAEATSDVLAPSSLSTEDVSARPRVPAHVRSETMPAPPPEGCSALASSPDVSLTTDKHETLDSAAAAELVRAADASAAKAEGTASIESTTELARAHRVLLTPQGARFSQAHAKRFAAMPALALICGRYEGFDERIRLHVDEEVSLGDFVMTGGEVAAMAVIEATVRLLPGVLGNATSIEEESHGDDGLLEYPQYTRPQEFRGEAVPEVLAGGNHSKIHEFREAERRERTRTRRPDLWAAYEAKRAAEPPSGKKRSTR